MRLPILGGRLSASVAKAALAPGPGRLARGSCGRLAAQMCTQRLRAVEQSTMRSPCRSYSPPLLSRRLRRHSIYAAELDQRGVSWELTMEGRRVLEKGNDLP